MSSVRTLLPKALDELHHNFVLFFKEFWTHNPTQLLVRLDPGTRLLQARHPRHLYPNNKCLHL